MKKLFDDTKVINKSPIPFRWIANVCGDISGWAILRISYLDELENYGWRYKLHLFIWKITWPIYFKFGTFYEWDFDMSGDGWDDYDSDGVPYWEKYHLDCLCHNCTDEKHCSGCMDCDNDFIDEETGDAFRLINKEQ